MPAGAFGDVQEAEDRPRVRRSSWGVDRLGPPPLSERYHAWVLFYDDEREGSTMMQEGQDLKSTVDRLETPWKPSR